MGGSQSISALSYDPTFNQKDNKYDIVLYKKICAEFDVDPSSDFRYKYGKTTVWAMCTLGLHMLGQDLLITTIQTQT